MSRRASFFESSLSATATTSSEGKDSSFGIAKGQDRNSIMRTVAQGVSCFSEPSLEMDRFIEEKRDELFALLGQILIDVEDNAIEQIDLLQFTRERIVYCQSEDRIIQIIHYDERQRFLRALIGALRANTSVRSICLVCIAMTDDLAELLKRMLKKNTSLRYLELYACELTDAGAESLSKLSQVRSGRLKLVLRGEEGLSDLEQKVLAAKGRVRVDSDYMDKESRETKGTPEHVPLHRSWSAPDFPHSELSCPPMELEPVSEREQDEYKP